MGWSKVFQFKVSLLGPEPAIWRRIQVPANYSFWDLHVAIQDSMGWQDYHLHVFKVTNPETKETEEIGIPFEDGLVTILPGWEFLIADYFSAEGDSCEYEYDFGDGWKHEIKLEKTLPANKLSDYPKCTAGERVCPPEDCGGIGGYQSFMEAISDPTHEEHEAFLRWVGGSFDAERFDPKEVRFDDPDERWQLAFAGET